LPAYLGVYIIHPFFSNLPYPCFPHSSQVPSYLNDLQQLNNRLKLLNEILQNNTLTPSINGRLVNGNGFSTVEGINTLQVKVSNDNNTEVKLKVEVKTPRLDGKSLHTGNTSEEYHVESVGRQTKQVKLG